jgi:hypothetical protein
VLLACRTRIDDAPEPAIGHDDEMIALLVVAVLGARRAAGDDPASSFTGILQPCGVQAHGSTSGSLNATPRKPRAALPSRWQLLAFTV